MLGLQAGDVVVVTKLDRLGRSTRELLDLIEQIGAAGAAFRSLGDDTTSSQGRLLLAVLAAIASFERDLIRERTSDGRRRAMAEGKRFGRKPKLSDYQRQKAIKRRAAGETLASIAKSYAVDISMISRLVPFAISCSLKRMIASIPGPIFWLPQSVMGLDVAQSL
jgi:DNA invertase Pin-like site-specific DNA recombinase